MNVKNYHIVMKEVTFVIMQSQAPMHSSILVTNPFTYIMEYIYTHTHTLTRYYNINVNLKSGPILNSYQEWQYDY